MSAAAGCTVDSLLVAADLESKAVSLVAAVVSSLVLPSEAVAVVESLELGVVADIFKISPVNVVSSAAVVTSSLVLGDEPSAVAGCAVVADSASVLTSVTFSFFSSSSFVSAAPEPSVDSSVVSSMPEPSFLPCTGVASVPDPS